MSIQDQLESDISAFFRNIEGQLPEARKKTLKLLIDKYAHLYSTTVVLDKHDFDMIKDHARQFFVNSSFPKKIGSTKNPGYTNKEISGGDINVLSIIEGTISVLNGKECLKRLPKFDYR